MKIAIRYASKSGNTKKIADAIGKAANVPAKAVDTPLKEPVDLLFIGASLYAGRIDGTMKAFLEGLTAERAKRVVIFSTAAGDKRPDDEIREILAKKGIAVDSESFHCRGKFLLANRSHPDDNDCRRAMKFAEERV